MIRRKDTLNIGCFEPQKCQKIWWLIFDRPHAIVASKHFLSKNLYFEINESVTSDEVKDALVKSREVLILW